jgi:hypothetical protein
MTDRRLALVLGRHPQRLPTAADVAGHAGIAVFAVGWPLSHAQDRAVEAMLSLSRTEKLAFDATLVGSVRDAASHLLPTDTAWAAGGRAERGRLHRAIARRGLNSLNVMGAR